MTPMNVRYDKFIIYEWTPWVTFRMILQMILQNYFPLVQKNIKNIFLDSTLGSFLCYILITKCSCANELCSSTRSDLKSCTTNSMQLGMKLFMESKLHISRLLILVVFHLKVYQGTSHQAFEEFILIFLEREKQETQN